MKFGTNEGKAFPPSASYIAIERQYDFLDLGTLVAAQRSASAYTFQPMKEGVQCSSSRPHSKYAASS